MNKNKGNNCSDGTAFNLARNHWIAKKNAQGLVRNQCCFKAKTAIMQRFYCCLYVVDTGVPEAMKILQPILLLDQFYCILSSYNTIVAERERKRERERERGRERENKLECAEDTTTYKSRSTETASHENTMTRVVSFATLPAWVLSKLGTCIVQYTVQDSFTK